MIPSRWFQNGDATSQAFRPMPDDNNKLSASDSKKISARTAFDKYNRDPSRDPAVGVLGVTVGECKEQKLCVVRDPQDGIPEHMLIDLSACESNNSIVKKSRNLKRLAIKRGWFYGPR